MQTWPFPGNSRLYFVIDNISDLIVNVSDVYVGMSTITKPDVDHFH